MARSLAIWVVVGTALLTTAAQALPESDRSRRAEARVRPALQAAVEQAGLDWGAPVFLRIHKQEKDLEVWLADGVRFQLFRRYRICAYSGSLGPKQREGDSQAPEGVYHVPAGAMNPTSRYHLSFNLGYPNAYDRAWRRTGGYLMVHGDCLSIGCYAMASRLLPIGADRNRPIEEIWTLMAAALRGGQKSVQVQALPFWRNLKQASDYFDRHKRPPAVSVVNKRYVFR